MDDKIDTVIGEIGLGVHRDYSVRYPWDVAKYAVDLAVQFQEKGTLPDHTKPVELDDDDWAILAVTSYDALEAFATQHPDSDCDMWIDEIRDDAENVINALLPEGYYAGGDGDAGGWGFWKNEEEN